MEIWTSCIGQRLDDADNTRTMLLADHLIRRGHEVTLWTSAFDHIRKEWRSEWKASGGQSYKLRPGLTVRFMKGLGYSKNISFRRLLDHVLAARDFRRQANSLPSPDAVVASMPDHVTAAAVIDFARSRNIPSLVDVRDKWPDIFVDYAPTALAKRIVRNFLFFESRRSRNALRRADALVAMMQSMLDWGLEKAGRSPSSFDRVFYLTTMDANLGEHADCGIISHTLQRAIDSTKGKIVFTFIGTYNRTQHPNLILDALDLLTKTGEIDLENIAVLIGGEGVDAEVVRARASEHANVHCLGWLRPHEMKAVLASSDVGLLPLNFPSPAFNNKAFAYLASGLPIINGALGDLADIIDAEGVGVNVRAGSAQAFSDAISVLAQSRARLSEMQKKVRSVYAARFDREKNYQAYVDHIEALVSSKSRLSTRVWDAQAK